MTQGFLFTDNYPLDTIGFQHYYHLPDAYEMSGTLNDGSMDYFLISAGMMDAKIRIMRRWLK